MLLTSVYGPFAVDSEENVEALHGAAVEKGVRLRVLIEVDVGMNRAGVAPGRPVLGLARKIATRNGLLFAGLMAWESPALRIADPAEKRPGYQKRHHRLKCSRNNRQ